MKYKALSRKEEAGLFRRYKDGDEKAFCLLVLHNMGLVGSVAAKFLPQQLFDELVSHGTIGLIEAIRGFDEGRGVRFSSYAVTAIRRHIEKGIGDEAWEAVRVPAYATTALCCVNRGDNDLSPEARLAAVYADFAKQVTRIDDDVSSRNLPDLDALNPFLGVERRDMIERLLECLSLRECDVIKGRFGLDGCPEETMREIGESYGTTRQRVAQIEATALRKMRDHAAANGLSMI
ncbi:MAG: sigma-70 family RNA polymerase sigma factor [Nanoarchaeota archaeon]|nr:sigma-70 family RNA polymerase sigma factor [Nanoarchaeota archaeon]